MRRYHRFLYDLFREHRGWKNRATLRKTSDICVNLLLRILLCLSLGHIPIRYCHFETLVKSKRRDLLSGLKVQYRSLQGGTSKDRRNYVLKFASLYSILLEPLFKEKPK